LEERQEDRSHFPVALLSPNTIGDSQHACFFSFPSARSRSPLPSLFLCLSSVSDLVIFPSRPRSVSALTSLARISAEFKAVFRSLPAVERDATDYSGSAELEPRARTNNSTFLVGFFVEIIPESVEQRV